MLFPARPARPRPALVLLAVVLLAEAAAAPAARTLTRDLGDDKGRWVGGGAAVGSADNEHGLHGLQGHHRVRRQNGEVVESIFQIPIQTLMAVSKVFTTSIQSVQRMREQFFQATRPTGAGASSSALYNNNYQQQLQTPVRPSRPSRPSRPGGGSSSSAFSSAYVGVNRPVYYPGYVLYNYSRPRSGEQSQAASVAGVATQGDGSSYRI